MVCAGTRAALRSEIEAWSFFHLGSDARLAFADTGAGLKVRFEHRRIHPYEVRFSGADTDRLGADPEALEQLLLDELARHRRSE